jgi:hypothetical protein
MTEDARTQSRGFLLNNATARHGARLTDWSIRAGTLRLQRKGAVSRQDLLAVIFSTSRSI